jgi:hypothetical protein
MYQLNILGLNFILIFILCLNYKEKSNLCFKIKYNEGFFVE